MNAAGFWRGAAAGAAMLAIVTAAAPAAAQERTLDEVVRTVTSRPEYLHSEFGIAVWDIDAARMLYGLNAEKLFTPASTTKLLTEGTALHLLGADYRFHTKVYRTGAVDRSGTLSGDLVLVASGDPNLSGRVQPDGTLAFENEDHAYDGDPDTKAVPGDPLLVLRELARQVAAKGIRRVAGHVRVDASLFPEGAKDLGTGLVISPIEVNDNIVDVTVGPGASVGAPVTLQPSPATSYVRFVNQATTAPADTAPEIHWASDVANPDGSHTVTVTGHMPAGKPAILFAYGVPEPVRFAEVAFAQALRDAGVEAQPEPPLTASAATRQAAAPYAEGDVVAEHVSPPLSEDVKVTLKVSQNLHASTMPYIVGAVLAHKQAQAEQAGFDLERDFLTKAGLDLSGASQGDGAGGAQSAFFTPDFIVHYLAYLARQPDYPIILHALPVLGRDGTLFNIETASPAAGHVFAKTGTFTAEDRLDRRAILTGKGLAGYTTTADGHHLAFALYANRVPLTPELKGGANGVGQALGEIATAIYSLPIR